MLGFGDLGVRLVGAGSDGGIKGSGLPAFPMDCLAVSVPSLNPKP